MSSKLKHFRVIEHYEDVDGEPHVHIEDGKDLVSVQKNILESLEIPITVEEVTSREIKGY